MTNFADKFIPPRLKKMNDGEPAFPQSDNTGNLEEWKHGMSLRDWFAGMALSGWYTNTGGLPAESHLTIYAAHFYLMADSMIAEREKHAHKD